MKGKASKKVKKAAKPAKKAVAKKATKPAKKIVAKKAKPTAKKVAKPVAKKKIVVKAKSKPAAAKKTAKPVAHKPVVHSKPTINQPHVIKYKKNNDNRLRYSDAELKEFRKLIDEKLEKAKTELKYYQEQITRSADNSTDDTENRFGSPEDGTATMEREFLTQQAGRQYQYIEHLESAIIRIENKTYGICRVTGKLIDKDRLRAVPHATMSIEAKLKQTKKDQPVVVVTASEETSTGGGEDND